MKEEKMYKINTNQSSELSSSLNAAGLLINFDPFDKLDTPNATLSLKGFFLSNDFFGGGLFLETGGGVSFD